MDASVYVSYECKLAAGSWAQNCLDKLIKIQKEQKHSSSRWLTYWDYDKSSVQA